MTAEQVVRTALIKQMFGISYDELAFQLGDSLVLRGFCRLSPSSPSPKRSALQANIASIRPETWEAMNRALVLNARERKVEDGRWMRTDTTVVESNIHHPLDSSLLFEGIRVLTRTLPTAPSTCCARNVVSCACCGGTEAGLILVRRARSLV
jgi:transposase, IS5 family